MVDKEKVMVNKKDFLILFTALIIVGVIISIFAASTMVTPVTWGNFSTTFNISITADGQVAGNITNVTCYYDAAGGLYPNATGSFLVQMINSSVDDVYFTNASIAALPDGTNYSISCLLYNKSGAVATWNSTIRITNVTFDSTPPSVTFFDPVTTSYVNGTVVISTTITDATRGIDSVYFNITDSTGAPINFTNATTDGTGYYNVSIDTTNFAEGVYDVTIWANDTDSKNAAGTVVTNLNNTESIQITIDNTLPTATYTCAPNTTIGQQVTCTCSGADATSGVNSTVTDITEWTERTSSPTQVITKITAKTAGTFSTTCVVKDKSGNIGATATASYTITRDDSHGSSGGSSGTTPTFTYSKTIPMNTQDFSEIKTIETSTFSGGGLGVKEKVTFRLGSEQHYVGIRTLTASSATIEIASTPTQVSLNIGEETKRDFDGDGFYDISIKMTDIVNGKAVLTISYIHEAVSTTPPAEEEEATPPAEETTETTSAMPVWIWIVLGAITVIAVVGVVIFLKQKKKRK